MDEIDIAQQRQAEDIARALATVQRHQGESAEICDECDEPIPEPRRLAVPGCRLCITCQKIQERRR